MGEPQSSERQEEYLLPFEFQFHKVPAKLPGRILHRHQHHVGLHVGENVGAAVGDAKLSLWPSP